MPATSPNDIIDLLSRIRERANQYICDELARRGITDLLPAHGAVLHALFKESPQPMSTLARRIGRKKNTVTGLVDTLQERGYCRRRPSDQDARVQLVSGANAVSLTPFAKSRRTSPQRCTAGSGRTSRLRTRPPA